MKNNGNSLKKRKNLSELLIRPAARYFLNLLVMELIFILLNKTFSGIFIDLFVFAINQFMRSSKNVQTQGDGR